MPSPAAALAIVVEANVTQAQAALAKTQAQLKELQATGAATAKSMEASAAKSGAAWTAAGKRMQSIGKSLTKYVTVPAVGVGVAATKLAMDFDKSMVLIQTQAGASAAEVKKLHEEVLAFARSGKTQFSPNELAQALYSIESAGIHGAQAMDTLKASSKLATVGQADLASTTKALAAAQKTGIKGSQDLKKEIGTLNATVGQGQMHMDDLVSAMGTGFLSTAAQMGLSLRDVGGALAELTKQGMPAAQSATRLRMTFSLMAAPTDTAAKALKTIGLNADDLANTMRQQGLLPALEMLQQHLQGLSKTAQTQVLSQAFGGGRTSAAILALVNNTDDLRTVLGNVKKNADQVGQSFQRMQQEPDVQLQRAWSQLQAVLIDMGNKLIPKLIPLIQRVANVAEKIITAFTSAPGWVQDFLIGAIVLGPFIRGLGAVARAYGAIRTAAAGAAVAEGAAGAAGAGGAAAGGGGLLARLGLGAGAAGAGTAAGVGAGVLAVGEGVKGTVGDVHSLGDAFKKLAAYSVLGPGSFVARGLREIPLVGGAIGGVEDKVSSLAHKVPVLGGAFDTVFGSGGDSTRREISTFADLIGNRTHDAASDFFYLSHSVKKALNEINRHMGESSFSAGLEQLKQAYGDLQTAAANMSHAQVRAWIELAKAALKNGDITKQEFAKVTKAFREGSHDQSKVVGDASKSVVQDNQDRMHSYQNTTAVIQKQNQKAIDSEQRRQKQVSAAAQREKQNVSQAAAQTAQNVIGSYNNLNSGVGQGLGKLQDMTNSALKALGLNKPVQFRTSAGAPVGAGGQGHPAGKQRGGMMVGGTGSGDKIPAMLEPGEFVLNREAVKGIGKARLESLNKAIPRFAKGGSVIQQALGPYTIPPIQYAPDHAGSNSHLHLDFWTVPQALTYGHKMQGMGWTIGEYTPKQGNPFHFGPITTHHQSPGHYDGTAFDANTPQDETRAQVAAVARLLNTGVAGGSAAAVVKKLKRVLLQGPAGPLLDMGQATLDKVRNAANSYIQKHAPKFQTTSFDGGKFSAKSGALLTRGKVSWFTGQGMAGGQTAATTPGVALNLNPGSDSGWNNSTTQQWMSMARAGHPQMANIKIGNHKATLPIVDLGPAGFTDRAIDVTAPGVRKLGFSTSNFPTDSIGSAYAAQHGGLVPSFGKGGIVPGPRNSPQPIIAHGGERVKRANEKVRYQITITNWQDGTGYMEEIADGAVNGQRRFHNQIARMNR